MTRYWSNYLSENGIPCGPIYYLNRVVEDPHIRSREMIFSIDDHKLGPIHRLGSPWKQAQTQEKRYQPPPEVGEYDEEVYGEWLGQEGLDELKSSKVIR